MALALWVRVMPRQAATPGLVIMALAAITQAGVAVTNNFNIGALTYAALAGMSTWAFWKLGRARTDDSGQSAEVSTGAFGARLADLLGVASGGPQVARLRWFFAARLAAGAFLGVLMQASQPYNQAFRVNVPFVVWVAATAPLALYYAFRALRQPLLSLLVAAVVTAALNPSVWFSGLGLVVLAQEVVGILLFAWATTDIASARLAMWFGAASASLAGTCIVHWLAPRFWPMSTTDYAAAVLVAAAFWSVFALGTLRKTG